MKTSTPDPQLRQVVDAIDKKFDEVFDNGDAAALAALFTEDGIFLRPDGTLYGREAIEKYYADDFQNVHWSNHFGKADEYSPHIIGTDGNEMWAMGEWSTTLQVQTHDPIQIQGYWSAIYAREGGVWKKRMVTANVTPPPAAPAETK